MSKQYILVTGASRGLGLEFVRQYAEESANNVIFATVRDPESATQLKELAATHKNIQVLALDVSNEESIRALPAKVEQYTKTLNLVINNAGIAHPIKNSTSGTIALSTLQNVFLTNSFSPILVTQALLPFLKNAPKDPEHLAKVVMITSSFGSIANNTSDNLVAYRASKSALNQLTKSFANEEKDIVFIPLHPGWVDTDMGSGLGKPPLTPAQSISSMRKVISSSKAEHSAVFVDFENKPLPW